MPHSAPARTAPHLRRSKTLAAAAAVTTAVVGLLVCQSLTWSTPASPIDSSVASSQGRPDATGLDPALRSALREAAADAADDGIELQVHSGWRSPEHQQQLLDEAIAEYGSEEEARRWVATPETSSHVSGDAIDIGPAEGTAWLAANGAAYGLCQTYRNEPWHYELHPEAVDGDCPPMYGDPTDDPRMQQ